MIVEKGVINTDSLFQWFHEIPVGAGFMTEGGEVLYIKVGSSQAFCPQTEILYSDTTFAMRYRVVPIKIIYQP